MTLGAVVVAVGALWWGWGEVVMSVDAQVIWFLRSEVDWLVLGKVIVQDGLS